METNYEKLKKKEVIIQDLKSVISNIDSEYKYLCFAKKPLREAEYYEGKINNTKQESAAVGRIDLPPGMRLKETILETLKNKLSELQAEFKIETDKLNK